MSRAKLAARMLATIRSLIGTSPGDLATLDATGKFPASIVPSSGGGLSAPINLLRNTDVYDRNSSGEFIRTGLPNHWSAVFPALSPEFNVHAAPNYVLFSILNTGPDATAGSVYRDLTDSSKRFKVRVSKASGDGSTFLSCSQISGSAKVTSATGNLTLETGAGDASIPWSAVPSYQGFALDVALVDGPYSASPVTEAGLTAAVGKGFEQTLSFDQEPDLYPEAVVSFCIPVGVASAGTVLKLDLLDQTGTSLGSSALSTAAAETGIEILTVENVTIPAGVTGITFRVTVTAVPGTVYLFPPTLSATPTVIPYAPRGLEFVAKLGERFFLNTAQATTSLTPVSLASHVPPTAVLARVSMRISKAASGGAWVAIQPAWATVDAPTTGLEADIQAHCPIAAGDAVVGNGIATLDDAQSCKLSVSTAGTIAIGLAVSGFWKWRGSNG